MALIRKLFWLGLFVFCTFAFVVLMDHGTTNYVKNFQAEFQDAKKLINWKPERKKDEDVGPTYKQAN